MGRPTVLVSITMRQKINGNNASVIPSGESTVPNDLNDGNIGPTINATTEQMNFFAIMIKIIVIIIMMIRIFEIMIQNYMMISLIVMMPKITHLTMILIIRRTMQLLRNKYQVK